MVLIALALLLIVSFLNNSKLFAYSLMVYFVFFDMFDGFYDDNKVFAAIRYIVPLSLILIYAFRYNVLKKLDFIFLLLLSYLLILWVVNSGDLLVTSRSLLSLLITLLMIPIGIHLGKRADFISDFEKYNRVLLIAIPLYIVYANIAGIGGFYTESFSTGFLVTSRMYIVPIVVFLAIHYAITNKDKSWFIRANDILFILINICIMLINTRRTALGMLIGAIFIYTLLNRRLIFKMVILIFVIIAALIVSYPLYEERLTAQLEKRERIQNLDTYEEEARYLETLYIIDYHEKRADIAKILFGVKLFDTYDFGTKYFGRDRPIHSDINMLFYSTGFIGIIIFALFVMHYFFRGNNTILKSDRQIYYPILIMFLMVLIPGRFIGTLTYAPLLMLILSSLKSGYKILSVAEPEGNELAVTVTN
jgi:hypothetical protein